MTTILLPCNVQLDYKDNLLENIVNLDFYSLNLWRILSGGLGWSSHTVKSLTAIWQFTQFESYRQTFPMTVAKTELN